jgi:acetyl esterase
MKFSLRSAVWAAFLIALALLAQDTRQQQKAQKRPPRQPDLEDVHYGPHERNVFDLYKAKSDKPTPLVMFIHGGAFLAGGKYLITAQLLDACAKAGISVASINHRYSTQAVFPAPYLDAVRALQFLRLHAAEYNLNPKMVALAGGSSGADISLWIGFHDDMAEPQSDDPVKRQSTRVSAIGASAAQSELDPHVVKKLVGESPAVMKAIRQLWGLQPDEVDSERAYKLYRETSPLTYLTKDDPPVFLTYYVPNNPITAETTDVERIHHPAFGFYLKERMDKVGVECILHLADDYSGPGGSAKREEDMVQFFLRHFPQP